MAYGSVYDYLHKQKATLKLPMLLRVAIDTSKGMDYLHQNNIIHRDLKAANLLMDENEVYVEAHRLFACMCISYPLSFLIFCPVLSVVSSFATGRNAAFHSMWG